jgi:hypothetical protein
MKNRLELYEAGDRFAPAEEESTSDGLPDAPVLLKGSHG